MTTTNQSVLTWVDGLYEKFEALRVDVEEDMYQGPVKYVDDQMKTVGVCVKKFCSDVMKDLENFADDVISEKPEAETAIEPTKTETYQLGDKDSFIKKMYLEIKEDLTDLANHSLSKESWANINGVNVKVDSSVTPGVNSEIADKRLSSSSGACRVKNVELPALCLDDETHAEFDTTKKYDDATNVCQSEALEPRVSFAGDLSQTSLGGTRSGSSDETVESYDERSMAKLGESCVIVDRIEGIYVSDLQGQQRSYKKKMKDVLYGRRRWGKSKLTARGSSNQGSRQNPVDGSSLECGKIQVQSEQPDLFESGWELI